MPDVQSLVSDPRVGPMCRWSLKAPGSNEKVQLMKNIQDKSRVPKKLLKYFVEMVDGNATSDLFTRQENQKQCLIIRHHLW